MKHRFYAVLFFSLVFNPLLFSQTVIDLDQIPGVEDDYASPLEIVEDGETFVLTITGGDPDYGFSSANGYAGELRMGDTAGFTVKITITHKEGKTFDFNNIDLFYDMADEDWSIKGFNGGSEVSGSPVEVVITGSFPYDRVATNFLQVDAVTLEENPVVASGFTIWCDRFEVDNVTDASLPVHLSTLTAVQENGAVALSWMTENETDNLGFLLERKTADTGWAEIASYRSHPELEGAGNTSSRTEYAFTDTEVLPGATYSYRLSDVDTDGNVTVKDVISITLEGTPLATDLLPVQPNPFNPSTKIQYTLAQDANVNLAVVDMMGRTVQTIISGQNRTAGNYSIHWNGRTVTGQDAASGIYLLVLKAGAVRKTQKVMLVR